MFSSINCRWMSSSRRRANLRANERLCFGFATHVFIKKLQMDELVEEADCWGPIWGPMRVFALALQWCKEFFKRAQFYPKNGHFFSQKMGIKREKLQNFNQKTWRFQKKLQNFFLEFFYLVTLSNWLLFDLIKHIWNWKNHKKWVESQKNGRKTGNFTKMPD